ncbi:MAG: hypothetical protein K2H08_05870, partial [Duncaniella sp.]|nr:hypothetical protein [Duncaniella sp.]
PAAPPPERIARTHPGPRHFSTRLPRGHTPPAQLAEAISAATGIPVADALCASFHRSQTRKNAHQRLLNARDVYSLEDISAIAGKHVLIVDDVITTGATMLSCIKAIKSASPSSEISVYSLAITRLC